MTMKNNSKKIILGIVLILFLYVGLGVNYSAAKPLNAVEKKSVVTKKEKALRAKFSDNKQLVDKQIVKSVDIFSLENKNAQEIRIEPEADFLPNGSLVKVNWNLELKEGSSKYNKGDIFEINIPDWIDVEKDGEGNIDDGSAGGTAKYYLSKSEGKIRIELIKDVVSAKYTIFTRANLKVKDDQKSILRELSFDTMTGKQTYHLSVPFNTKKGNPNIYLPKGKLAFYNATGQADKKMPVKAKIEYQTNQYQLNLDRIKLKLYNSMYPSHGVTNKIISESIKIYGKENKSTGEELSPEELITKDKYDVLSQQDGSIEIKFKGKYRKMLRFTYDVEINYDDFKPSPGTKQIPFNPYLSFTENTLINYPIIKSTNVELIGDYIEVESKSAREYLKLKTIDTQGRLIDILLYVNLDEKELKKGSELLLSTTNHEVTYLNKILNEPIKQTHVSMTEDGKETLEKDKFKTSNDWEVLPTDNGHKLKLVYKGETTTDSLALQFRVGTSANRNEHINKYIVTGKDDLGKEEKSELEVRTSTLPIVVNNKISATQEDQLELNFTNYENNTNLGHITLSNFTFEIGPSSDGLKPYYLEGLISSDLKGKAINGSIKNLVENEDYKISVLEGRKVVITFLKENMNYQLLGNLKLKYDMSNFITSSLNYQSIYIDSFIEERGTGLKRYHYENQSFSIDQSLYKNIPFSVSEHVNRDTELDKRYENKEGQGLPINSNLLVVNPKKQEVNQPKVTITSDSYNNLNQLLFYDKKEEDKIMVYKLENKLNTSDYNYQSIIEKLKPIDNSLYTIKELDASSAEIIFNKKINDPVVIKSRWKTSVPTLEIPGGRIKYKVTDSEDMNDSTESRMDMASSLRGTATWKKNQEYDNVGDLDLAFQDASKTKGKIIKGTTIVFTPNVKNFGALEIMNGHILLRDEENQELPSNLVRVIKDSNQFKVVFNADMDARVKLTIPIVSSTSQSVSFNSQALIHYESNSRYTYTTPALVNLDTNSLELIPDSSGGSGNLTLTSAKLTVRDKGTGKGIPNAIFELKDDVSNHTQLIGPSDENGNIHLNNALVSKYYLKQLEPPEGYDLNSEYSEGSGKELRFSENSVENNFFVDLSATSRVVVKFTYADGTPILEKNIEAVTIVHPKHTPLDLTTHPEIKKVKDKMKDLSSDYRLIKFDAGNVTGTENNLVLTEDTQTVFYKYEGLVSINAPDQLTFEKGKASPFKQELKTKLTEPFKLVLRDNRQQSISPSTESFYTRGNFKIQARLSHPFEGVEPGGHLANSTLLYFKGSQPFSLEGVGSEILQSVQESAGPEKKTFEYILDDPSFSKKNDGFILDVPAGEAKAQTYQGEMSFDFIQGP